MNSVWEFLALSVPAPSTFHWFGFLLQQVYVNIYIDATQLRLKERNQRVGPALFCKELISQPVKQPASVHILRETWWHLLGETWKARMEQKQAGVC